MTQPVEVDTTTAGMEREEAFHALLSTLAGAIDIRDVFQRLSVAAAPIIQHDDLALLTEDGAHFRVFATTLNGEPALVCPDEGHTVPDPSTPRVFRCGFVAEHGFQTGLSVPLQVDGKLIGVLALLSRRADAYDDRDVRLAQRIGEYVAIALSRQQLAEAAQRAALERDRAANLESSVELLRAIAGVLDIRTVFPRVSEIANKVLPHDRLTLSFDDSEGLVIEAASDDELPVADRITLRDADVDRSAHHGIIDDLRTQRLPIAEPADLHDRVVAAGYRSLLAVNTRARDQVMGLEFWSKQPAAFTNADVPVARRIADHVALAVSHEQLAEAARQIAEARARAERLEARVKSLANELELRAGHGRAIGESSGWKDALRKATQVAATETTALLTGESGTGKEVLARFIHRASPRSDGPFVAINCAALPEQLLESELFGFERGAFTGAQQAKPGQIELAAGGVLFLDEVSEMSLSAQAKFLRVLQEREFQRLGGTRSIKANVRIVAATNRNLREAVDRGAFREDLFYRLQVFDIRIPPLRERRDDIPLLTDRFLEEIGRTLRRPAAGLTRDAREALQRYDWPGNIRELRNALERAAILCDGGVISAQHLALRHDVPAAPGTTDLNAVERQTIEHVMRDTGWNKSKAARRLGLSRTQLYVRLRRHDLEPPRHIASRVS